MSKFVWQSNKHIWHLSVHFCVCIYLFLFWIRFFFLFHVHYSLHHLWSPTKNEIKHEFIDLLCLWSLAALWIARRHGWFVPKRSELKLASVSTASGLACFDIVLCVVCWVVCLFYRVQWVLAFSSKSPYIIIWHVFCFGKPINRLIAITFNTGLWVTIRISFTLNIIHSFSHFPSLSPPNNTTTPPLRISQYRAHVYPLAKHFH